MDKKELRKEIILIRDALPVEVRNKKSALIADKVIKLKEFQNANVVLLYHAIRSEVETSRIYEVANQLGKTVYCPRVLGDKMEFYLADDSTEYEISKYGIREPKMIVEKSYAPKVEDRVIVLMPGAAYDEEGNRIGYGGGYYDKYLEWLETKLGSKNVCKVSISPDSLVIMVLRVVPAWEPLIPEFAIRPIASAVSSME